jgi:hypothetical protein
MSDPCKKFACAIQSCLEKNNYQEEKCKKQLENLLDCCRKNLENSFVCEGYKKELEIEKKK